MLLKNLQLYKLREITFAVVPYMYMISSSLYNYVYTIKQFIQLSHCMRLLDIFIIYSVFKVIGDNGVKICQDKSWTATLKKTIHTRVLVKCTHFLTFWIILFTNPSRQDKYNTKTCCIDLHWGLWCSSQYEILWRGGTSQNTISTYTVLQDCQGIGSQGDRTAQGQECKAMQVLSSKTT